MLKIRKPASSWLKWHGLADQIRLNFDNPPAETGEEMRRFARWLENQARALRKLALSLQAEESGRGISWLMEYVRQSTGKYRDALVAELLNAATDALGRNETFSEEALKKMRQRNPLRRSKASAHISEIAKIFPNIKQ